MIYLASPYNHEDPAVKQDRFEQICEVAVNIMRGGKAVYCPIAHNHPLALQHNLPGSWDFWKLMDLPILAKANELWVIKLDGWKTSGGIKEEVAFAKACSIPVHFYFPEEILG